MSSIAGLTGVGDGDEYVHFRRLGAAFVMRGEV